MLAEITIYLASLGRTPPGFRPHLGEAVGLWARGRRQQRAWAPHQRATIDVIESAAPELERRRTVAVLGSGPLFDIPVESLARQFARVLLIDRAHVATGARLLRAHPNAERMWRDLAPDGDPHPLAFLAAINDLDWVISVNLLSQLARGAPAGGENAVIDAHLAGLSALRAPVTLITDTSYRVLDRQDREIESSDLLHGHKLPEPSRRWEWEVAPFGEESPDTRRIHTVFAFPDWHRAAGLGSGRLFV